MSMVVEIEDPISNGGPDVAPGKVEQMIYVHLARKKNMEGC